MSWFRISDQLHSHPKFAVSLEAIGIWILCLSWSMDQNTAGDLPHGVVKRFGDGKHKKLAKELVITGLWKETPTGYQICDFNQYLIGNHPVRVEWDRMRSYTAPLVYESHGRACYYCGKDTNLTIDHIVPIDRGGGNDIDNLVPACRSCNSSKNNKTVEEWQR